MPYESSRFGALSEMHVFNAQSPKTKSVSARPPLGRIQRTVQALLSQGVQHVDGATAVYVRQTNLNGLLYFALDLILALVFDLVLDRAHLSLGLLVSAFAFLMGSVGFNAIGWTTLSRISTVSIGSLLVLYCAFYLGPSSFAACSLLLGAVFPFVYFSTKEVRAIAFTLAVPLACYTLLVFLDYDLGPRFEFANETTARIVQMIFFLVPLIGVAANAYAAVQERETKNLALQDSKNQLEIIFHALSHDLATPLQTVAILSKFASEDKLTPVRVARLQMATEQTMRIFQNLIKISQLTSEKSKLLLMPASITSALNEAIAFIEADALKKNVKIRLELSSEIASNPPEVMIEREAFIFQVITNFLTNAVKFSEEGSEVKIRVDALASSSAPRTLKISIVDSGCGIESHRLEHLFSWDIETSTVGTLGEKGHGFGLPLARKFLEAMNGDVVVVSRPAAYIQKDMGPKFKFDCQWRLLNILVIKI